MPIIKESSRDIRDYSLTRNDDGTLATTDIRPVKTDDGLAILPFADSNGNPLEEPEVLRRYKEEDVHFGVYDSEEDALQDSYLLARKQSDSYLANRLSGLAYATRNLTPEAVAKADLVGDSLSIDPRAVNARNIKQFHDHMEAVNFDPYELLKEHRSTALWALEHPHHLVAAKNDFKALGGIHRAINLYGEAFTQARESIAAGSLYTRKYIFGEDVDDQIAQQTLRESDFVVAPSDFAGKLAYKSGEFLGQFSHVIENVARRSLEWMGLGAAAGAVAGTPFGGVGAAPGAMGGAVAGFTSGASYGMYEAIFQMEMEDSMREMDQMRTISGNPLDRSTIVFSSVVAGVANAALEGFSVKQMLKLVPGMRDASKSMIRKVMHSDNVKRAILGAALDTGASLTVETVTEGVQRAITMGMQELGKAMGDQVTDSRSLSDIWTESVDEAEEALWSFGAYAGFGGGMSVVLDSYNAYRNKKRSLGILKATAEAVKESKMREENPVAFKSFMQRATPKSRANLYINAAELNEYFESTKDLEGLQEFLKLLNIDEVEFAEKVANSGTLEVSTIDVASNIWGNERFEKTEEFMSFESDGQTIQTTTQAAAQEEFFNFFQQEFQKAQEEVEVSEKLIDLNRQLVDLGYSEADAETSTSMLFAHSRTMHMYFPDQYEYEDSWLKDRVKDISAESGNTAFSMAQARVIHADFKRHAQEKIDAKRTVQKGDETFETADQFDEWTTFGIEEGIFGVYAQYDPFGYLSQYPSDPTQEESKVFQKHYNEIHQDIVKDLTKRYGKKIVADYNKIFDLAKTKYEDTTVGDLYALQWLREHHYNTPQRNVHIVPGPPIPVPIPAPPIPMPTVSEAPNSPITFIAQTPELADVAKQAIQEHSEFLDSVALLSTAISSFFEDQARFDGEIMLSLSARSLSYTDGKNIVINPLLSIAHAEDASEAAASILHSMLHGLALRIKQPTENFAEALSRSMLVLNPKSVEAFEQELNNEITKHWGSFENLGNVFEQLEQDVYRLPAEFGELRYEQSAARLADSVQRDEASSGGRTYKQTSVVEGLYSPIDEALENFGGKKNRWANLEAFIEYLGKYLVIEGNGNTVKFSPLDYLDAKYRALHSKGTLSWQGKIRQSEFENSRLFDLYNIQKSEGQSLKISKSALMDFLAKASYRNIKEAMLLGGIPLAADFEQHVQQQAQANNEQYDAVSIAFAKLQEYGFAVGNAAVDPSSLYFFDERGDAFSWWELPESLQSSARVIDVEYKKFSIDEGVAINTRWMPNQQDRFGAIEIVITEPGASAFFDLIDHYATVDQGKTLAWVRAAVRPKALVVHEIQSARNQRRASTVERNSYNKIEEWARLTVVKAVQMALQFNKDSIVFPGAEYINDLWRGKAPAKLYNTIIPKIVRKIAKEIGGEINVVNWDFDSEKSFPGLELKFKDKSPHKFSYYQKIVLQQGRTDFDADGRAAIVLQKSRDNSTMLHETGHVFLESLKYHAGLPDAPSWMLRDLEMVERWTSKFNNDDVLQKYYDENLRHDDQYRGREFSALTEEELNFVRDTAKHEQFARGFEAYLREGRAPVAGLKETFRRFKKWLIGIYKSVRDLDVTLNDEIRSVFERLIADEQEIESHKKQLEKASVIDTETVANELTAEEMQEAKAVQKDSEEESKEEISAINLKNWRRRLTKWRREIAKEVDARREYILLDRLTRGETSGTPVDAAEELEYEGKSPDEIQEQTGWKRSPSGVWVRTWNGPGLNKEAFVDIFGENTVKKISRHRGLMRKEGGLAPGELRVFASELFNDASEDQIVNELSKMPSRSAAIRQRLDHREQTAVAKLRENGFNMSTHGRLKMLAHEINLLTKIIIRKEFKDLKNFDKLKNQVETLKASLYEAKQAVEVDEEAVQVIQSELDKATTKYEKLQSRAQEEKDAVKRDIQKMRTWLGNKNVSAIRDYAQRLVQQMKFKDIKKSINQTSGLARRMGDHALRAAARGDFRAALEYRKIQFTAEVTIVELVKVQSTLATTRTNLRRWMKSSAIQYQYREWLRRLARRFGLLSKQAYKALKKRPVDESLFSLLNFEDEGETIQFAGAFNSWIMTSDEPMHWTEMTIEELTDLDNILKALKKVGANERKVRADGKIVEATTIADFCIRRMQTLKDKKNPLDRRFKKARQWYERHRAQQTMLLDFAFKAADGYSNEGPFNKYIIQRIKSMRNAKLRMMNQLYKELKPYNVILHRGYVRRAKRFDIPGVAVPEAFQKHHGESKWTTEMLYAVVLNSGCAENLSALQHGWNLSDQDLSAIRNQLTIQEMNAIQGIWDILDSLFDPANKVHMEVFGFPAKRVEGVPFTTGFGTYRGGYYPMAIDWSAAPDAKEAQERRDLLERRKAMRKRPTVNRTFMISRKGTKLPPRLDINVVHEHVNEVMHMITHLQGIRDIDKITSVPEFRKAFTNKFGEALYTEIREFLFDIGHPTDGLKEEGDRWVKWAINRGSLFGLAYRVTAMIRQLPAVFPAIKEIGLENISHGYSVFLKNPAESIRFIQEASDYMRERMGYREYDVKQATKGLDVKQTTFEVNGHLLSADDIRAFGFYGLRAFEMAVSLPSWLGAYHREFAKSGDHELARHKADDLIETTQGAMDLYSLSRVQRRWSAARLLTMFSSWALQYGNRTRYHFNAWKAGKMSTAEFARHIWYEQILQPMAEWALISIPSAMIFGTGDEDPEEYLFRDAVISHLGFYLGGGLISRQLGALLLYGRDLFSTPAAAGAEALSSAILHGWAASQELWEDGELKEDRLKWLMLSTADVASFIAGIPVSRVYKDIDRAVTRLEE